MTTIQVKCTLGNQNIYSKNMILVPGSNTTQYLGLITVIYNKVKYSSRNKEVTVKHS